jgi:hypothetical protein
VTPQELEHSYYQNKHRFHHYLDSIKKRASVDIFTILNATLIKNPYTSIFPKNFFSRHLPTQNSLVVFIQSTILFYTKNFYLLFTYFISYMLYKIYFIRKRITPPLVLIDVFTLVDTINRHRTFKDPYFTDLYDVFEKYSQPYTILIRLYGAAKNPFKLIPFFKIINQEHRDFLFEFEVLSMRNFLELAMLILAYPFKTLRLSQKSLHRNDKIFNHALLHDIKTVGFEAFSRYILGKNLAQVPTIKTIFSWSEFQAVERSFNFGIRKNNPNIKLIGCQFFLNYETYFNAYVDDLDFEMLSSSHTVLVNGDYYILDRNRLQYGKGVSLRYKELFHFDGIQEEKNVIVLGSYIESDTKYMLKSVSPFSNVIFKNHPAVNINHFYPLPDNIAVSDKTVYELFVHAKIVICSASGTAVEAVSCGLSVIIIASQEYLTANPLVEYGKGEIWDIAFSKDDISMLYNKLLTFRQENRSSIHEISRWYKENFFIEPTEENISKTFNLRQ